MRKWIVGWFVVGGIVYGTLLIIGAVIGPTMEERKAAAGGVFDDALVTISEMIGFENDHSIERAAWDWEPATCTRRGEAVESDSVRVSAQWSPVSFDQAMQVVATLEPIWIADDRVPDDDVGPGTGEYQGQPFVRLLKFWSATTVAVSFNFPEDRYVPEALQLVATVWNCPT